MLDLMLPIKFVMKCMDSTINDQGIVLMSRKLASQAKL